MNFKKTAALLITIFLLPVTLASEFTPGPAIENFGENAIVTDTKKLDKEQKFNVVFDIAKQGDTDKPNRSINSLARFINMHIRAGVKPENINLVLVVHGKASNDLLNNQSYQNKFDLNNPNHSLIKELLKNRTEIFLCGQSAAYYEIEMKDLQKGVQLSLSAMTAHALLQQQGYTLNPF